MKCYLAHPVTDYGGSERQMRAVGAIQARGWTVENPDQPTHQTAYEQHGMQHFVDVVGMCDALAFLRFESGEIGAGVAKEIAAALGCRLPVYDATSGYLKPTGVVMPLGVISVDETRAKLRALRMARAA